MAVKFLIMMALLQMGACVPAPEPDPHNIVVQVQQEVNSDCCNGGCPCPPKLVCKDGVVGTCRKECESGEKNSGVGCEKDGVECDLKCCVEGIIFLPVCEPAICVNSTTGYGICNYGRPAGWTDAGVADCSNGCECYSPPGDCEKNTCLSSLSVWFSVVGICAPPSDPPPSGWILDPGAAIGCDDGCKCYIPTWNGISHGIGPTIV